ncbi:gp53-like domain-containing protein [Azospirillum tabaci]|uniref:gp53-like domain-containing protein n=1 Tax=Azospirillum tabaci TaxID=2752310 RepID=UPI0016611F20|nr:hypothetical protein [Azospirillum tabaci]
MKRIDTPTRAVDLFGAGKPGFKDGSTLTGDPATTLNAGMFNHFQEEIARAIEACGITLDPGQYDQLAQALGLNDRNASATGHIMLAGGILFNWGSGVMSAGSCTVTFDKAFPTACWHAFPAENTASTWATNNVTVYGPSAKSQTGATFKSFTWNGTGFVASSAAAFSYFAIGK